MLEALSQQTKPIKQSIMLTRKEAAEMLRIRPQTLASWACTSKVNIPYIKIGSRVVYRYSDIIQFIESNLVQREEI